MCTLSGTLVSWSALVRSYIILEPKFRHIYYYWLLICHNLIKLTHARTHARTTHKCNTTHTYVTHRHTTTFITRPSFHLQCTHCIRMYTISSNQVTIVNITSRHPFSALRLHWRDTLIVLYVLHTDMCTYHNYVTEHIRHCLYFFKICDVRCGTTCLEEIEAFVHRICM